MRLLVAQGMVLLAGAATTVLVAAIVGPPLFREHLHRAGVPAQSMEELHAEEAYGYATALSIGGALAVSAVAALAVSWYISRRLQGSITEVAEAATAVAGGHYGIRVTPPRMGDDFDALADAFNRMATQLQAVDATRRRLFGDLAHEIRTPVAILEAYIEALEDGVRTLTPETAAVLRDQTQRLVRFSGDVAALAQAEESAVSMSFTSIDLGDFLNTVLETAQDRFDTKGVRLGAEIPPDLPPLRGDRQRLAQVMGNLLDNALRHTSFGGGVTMTVTSIDNELVIRVIDTGDGIAAEHLPHVFQRFYRVDAARDRHHGGAGIGLAITKALAEAHGGHVVADSNGMGMGATFSVHLPLASADCGRSRPTSDAR